MVFFNAEDEGEVLLILVVLVMVDDLGWTILDFFFKPGGLLEEVEEIEEVEEVLEVDKPLSFDDDVDDAVEVLGLLIFEGTVEGFFNLVGFFNSFLVLLLLFSTDDVDFVVVVIFGFLIFKSSKTKPCSQVKSW